MTDGVTSAATRQSRAVLLSVDDDPGVSQAVARDLRRQYGERFRILRVDSGVSALEVLRQIKLRGDDAALLVADYRMPEMNDVTFLKHSMDLFPKAKRVLLTAYADTDAAIQAINQVYLCIKGGVRCYFMWNKFIPPEIVRMDAVVLHRCMTLL